VGGGGGWGSGGGDRPKAAGASGGARTAAECRRPACGSGAPGDTARVRSGSCGRRPEIASEPGLRRSRRKRASDRDDTSPRAGIAKRGGERASDEVGGGPASVTGRGPPARKAPRESP